MPIPVPETIKIYHIVHLDKLSSIINDGFLYCDAVIQKRHSQGTTIGMDKIKRRRLEELTLSSYPDLHVGDCVPFYFCPRSVMLYMFFRHNHPEIAYRDGQEPIVHLVADMHETQNWAEGNHLRCAFTTSNAGAYYFNDYTSVSDLDKINWSAVFAENWQGMQEDKQAEFLIEQKFPWQLVEKIGVYSELQYSKAAQILKSADYQPVLKIERNWYY